MKEKEIYRFKEGEYVFSTKIQGIHRVLRVFEAGVNRPQVLNTEHLYSPKYEKIQGKFKDREYTIDGAFCKPIDLEKLLQFEKTKFDRICKIIQDLIQKEE